MQKVTPFPWFDRQAEETAKFYVSVFKDGKLGKRVAGPENAVWCYEQPYDEMAAIKDRLAFYPDKVEIKPS